MLHFLRDRGFLIKVPPSWRVLHARGRKLQGAGVAREAVARRLGVNQSRWEEIERACGVGVVPMGVLELGEVKVKRALLIRVSPSAYRVGSKLPISGGQVLKL